METSTAGNTGAGNNDAGNNDTGINDAGINDTGNRLVIMNAMFQSLHREITGNNSLPLMSANDMIKSDVNYAVKSLEDLHPQTVLLSHLDRLESLVQLLKQIEQQQEEKQEQEQRQQQHPKRREYQTLMHTEEMVRRAERDAKSYLDTLEGLNQQSILLPYLHRLELLLVSLKQLGQEQQQQDDSYEHQPKRQKHEIFASDGKKLSTVTPNENDTAVYLKVWSDEHLLLKILEFDSSFHNYHCYLIVTMCKIGKRR